MINYVVATNLKRFVRFAFEYTSLRSHRSPHMVLLLAINQSAMCSTNRMVLGVDLARLSFRRRRRTARDQLIRPGTRSIADSGAVRQDLRSKINRATTSSVQAINTSNPRGRHRLLAGQRPWMLMQPSVT